MSAPAGSDRQRDSGRRGGLRRRRLLCGVAILAAAAGVLGFLTGAGTRIENTTVNLRFSLRPAVRPDNLLIVAVDERTLNALQLRWPFPRSLDARAVEILHADHAGTIAYDVQFTQPTAEAEDAKLYSAIAGAPGMVLATTEIGPHGETSVLGGNANLAAAGAQAAAANFRPDSSGVIQKYSYSVGGLKTIAVAGAERQSGHRVAPGDFVHNSAWIDYPGPPGTIPRVSFSDLVKGRVDPAQVAGKIIVIGATSPVLQDIHLTSASTGTGMAGPEVQADAILSALHGNPLREAPGWLTLLAILLGGAGTPLLCLWMRPLRAFVAGLACAGLYGLLAQFAFDHDLILGVVYPLAAAVLGMLGAVLVCFLAETWERELAERYGHMLEAAVEDRTGELRRTQLGVIRRLAQAAELRDEDTGRHIERVGRICERLALELGMSPADAQQLRIASALHDVGKIGVPDRVLLKRGELEEDERELMQTHTATGAQLLAGSNSPVLQLAEIVARTHHEWWDGSGYPCGLRGEEIPLGGRICAVADVFDALSSPRHYKDSWSFASVVTEILGGRGTHFDPRVVDAFMLISGELEHEHDLAASEMLFGDDDPFTKGDSRDKSHQGAARESLHDSNTHAGSPR